MLVTFSADVEIVDGTATQRNALRASEILVDGVPVKLRKTDKVPTLRLTDTQFAALIADDFASIDFEAGTVTLPDSIGRGRPAKVGTSLAARAAAAKAATEAAAAAAKADAKAAKAAAKA